MNIKIKPTLIAAEDYHEFTDLKNRLNKFNIQCKYEEFNVRGRYNAIFWVEGSEDELFYEIFTDQEMFELIQECYLNGL